MIKEIHVFDFDGTLVDSSHRYRLNDSNKIDLNYWIENEHKAMNDKPLPLLKFYNKLQKDNERYPIIATARVWDETSKKYARKHNISGHIIARKDRADNRKGAELKIKGIKRLLNLKQFSNVKKIVIYEDNIEYLETLMRAFDGLGVFVPSNQGY
jgi:phosphoglycolate phosphatase-like HAD superfamily hydrolase